MGKMVYTALTADGVAVPQVAVSQNTICVIHDISIANNDAGVRTFSIKRRSIEGEVIWEVDMPANTPQHFGFDGILEGLPPNRDAVTVTETVTYANAAPDTATRASGSWIDDGFVVGDKFTLVGSSGGTNDGTYTISALTDTILTIGASENFTTFTAQTEDAVWTVIDRGDLFMDTDATSCTISFIGEQGVAPRG